MRERQTPETEVPLELKLLHTLSRKRNDRVQSETSGESAKIGELADAFARLWGVLGSSEVGGLTIPTRDRQEHILLNWFSEDDVVELIGALAIRATYLDRPRPDVADPAARARLVLDNEQDWLPGLSQRYRDALSKIATNQVVPPVSTGRRTTSTPPSLIRRWITGKLFPGKDI